MNRESFAQNRHKIKNEQNKLTLCFKKYLRLKYKLIEVVSYGMIKEYGSFEENYKIVAQGYELGEKYVQEALQKLKENKQNKRIINNILFF